MVIGHIKDDTGLFLFDQIDCSLSLLTPFSVYLFNLD
jgi:hypothetical protein